jgi:UDP-N-acetylmuramate--alanine ligase
MHVFFSGIGGTAIGPLAQIAHQAGYDVSGSDKQSSGYIDYLVDQGITNINIGQDLASIEHVHADKPIDWLVYSSAVAMEQSESTELQFCRDHHIKTSKRDTFIANFIKDKNLQMIAIAGTHGKTTTTAMVIWLLEQSHIPISYSVGAKLSFGNMGQYDERSKYFVYEADEFDKNFLAFKPAISIITGIDWDHPDIYPTRDEYNQAFSQFISQSQQAFLWSDDAEKLNLQNTDKIEVLTKGDKPTSALVGQVNRENASIVAQAMMRLLQKFNKVELVNTLNDFPGVSRRFEKISDNIYSDYAHTPAKIRGALQIARETTDGNIVVVYEGLHNTRQHFIKNELPHLFEPAKDVYIVPNYRAREDESLEDLTPDKLAALTSDNTAAKPALLNDDLLQAINRHTQAGDLVLCLSAGGGGSLDEWLRNKFTNN